ncbi:MAG: tetratricopeptide repeat protein [Syntrophotaleaceae bacterium]
MRGLALLMTVTLCLVGFAVPAFAQVPVNEQARRHFDRGTAAVEIAESQSDFAAAAREFEEAVRLAPEWPEAYYNLGLVREKLEDLEGAISSLNRYLELAPGAADAAAVRSQLNKIEYKRDKRGEMKNFFDILARPIHTKRLVNETGSCQKWTKDMVVSGNKVIIVNSLKQMYNSKEIRKWAEDYFDVQFDNKKYNYKAIHYKCTAETSRGFKTDPYCPTNYSVSGEIVSLDPITLKEDIVVFDKMIPHNNGRCNQVWEIHE